MSDPYTDEQKILNWKENRYMTAAIKKVKKKKEEPKKPKGKKAKLWLAQNCKCYYCNTPTELEMGVREHIIPRSKGGKDKNTVFACKECDLIKKNYLTVEEYDAAILRLKNIQRKVKDYVASRE